MPVGLAPLAVIVAVSNDTGNLEMIIRAAEAAYFIVRRRAAVAGIAIVHAGGCGASGECTFAHGRLSGHGGQGNLIDSVSRMH